MLVQFLVRLLMRSFLATYRLEVRGAQVLSELRTLRRPIIYAFWHGEQFVLIPYHRRQGIGIMVSLSRDGEAQARLLSSLGYVPVRGSSSKRAATGLVALIHHVRKGSDAGMAVDGPRGPLHEVKPGVVTLAYKSGAAIVPLRVHPTACWRLGRTWDAYFIPRPFSSVILEYREPLELTGDTETDVQAVAARLGAPLAS